jgi:GSH-dependent disulfide-bond oxidoreductase
MSIQLYTWDTPNGHNISIALEEMGIPYRVHTVDIFNGEQFDPAFLKIDPNSRIPAIVDSAGAGGEPISVFESGAILVYLGEKSGKFWPKADLAAQVPVLEWLIWQVGGFGPMPHQLSHFLAVNNEADRHYGMERYSKETRRLYGVLDKRLGSLEAMLKVVTQSRNSNNHAKTAGKSTLTVVPRSCAMVSVPLI